MDNKTQKQNYKNYISGLKGFACIMVMIGHYIGLYKYAENFQADNIMLSFFDTFHSSKISFLLDETFWVILFFVISGYLVSMSNVGSLASFLKKSVMRFLRLGIPVFLSIAIIFAIYKFIGFHTNDTDIFMINPFIQKAYTSEYNIFQVLMSPFDVLIFGDVSLNSPFWVLREMLISSIIIYFLQFLHCKIKNNSLFLSIVGIVFFISMILSNVIFAGIFGYIINLIENHKNNKITSEKIFVFLAILFSVSLYFIPRTRIACIFFGSLVLLIPKLPFVCSIFSSKVAQYINKISFGVYAFHWPVFCSIGMLCLINIALDKGLIVASIISSVVSVILTFLISVCFYHFIEKWIYILLKKIDLKTGRYIK